MTQFDNINVDDTITYNLDVKSSSLFLGLLRVLTVGRNNFVALIKI